MTISTERTKNETTSKGQDIINRSTRNASPVSRYDVSPKLNSKHEQKGTFLKEDFRFE